MMPGTSSVLVVGRTEQPAPLIIPRVNLADFWTLTKPEVNFLILIATSAGFYLGYPGSLHAFPLQRLMNTLLGTLLVASGTGTLNQFLEHRFDARMRRTQRRPVASGRMRPATAAWFGLALSAVGVAYLVLAANAIAGLLAVFTLTSYLFVYTPLKRRTPLCTLVGAIPGAMPPLIGWAAANGSLTSSNAWILFSLLFFWQFPHFMAIAWMYREDYAQAGYSILPTEGEFTFLTWQTCFPSLALLLASIAAVGVNGERTIEYWTTLLLGIGLLYYAVRFVLIRSRPAARQLLQASIAYLPIEFLILVLGKR
jgi:protoheme IX farnesyltransferase